MTEFRWMTAGESHGPGLTVIVGGVPSGLEIDEDYIERQMARRQKGYGSGGRMKIEKDRAELRGGVRHGVTIGAPIAMWIENLDHANWRDPMAVHGERPDAETARSVTRPRPGHAGRSTRRVEVRGVHVSEGGQPGGRDRGGAG